MATKNLTISVSEEVFERLRPYRGRLNISAAATAGIVDELERLESTDRAEGEELGRSLVNQVYEAAPVVVQSEIRRGEGKIAPPPEMYGEIARRAAGRPAYMEAAISGWNAGSADIWARLRNES